MPRRQRAGLRLRLGGSRSGRSCSSLRDGFIAGLAGRHEFALCLTGSSDRSLVRGVLSVALGRDWQKGFREGNERERVPQRSADTERRCCRTLTRISVPATDRTTIGRHMAGHFQSATHSNERGQPPGQRLQRTHPGLAVNQRPSSRRAVLGLRWTWGANGLTCRRNLRAGKPPPLQRTSWWAVTDEDEQYVYAVAL